MVADEVGEHVIEAHDRDGEDEHDPEQASELPDVIAVTGMPMIVSAVALVVRVGVMAVVATGSLAMTLMVVVRVMTGVGAGCIMVRVLGVRVRTCRGLVAHGLVSFIHRPLVPA